MPVLASSPRSGPPSHEHPPTRGGFGNSPNGAVRFYAGAECAPAPPGGNFAAAADRKHRGHRGTERAPKSIDRKAVGGPVDIGVAQLRTVI